MILFQLADSTRVVDQAFKINPNNIYQFLVAGLVVIVIALCAVIVFLWKQLKEREKRHEELTVTVTTVAVNSASVLSSLMKSVDELPEHIERHKVDIKDALRDSVSSILRTIDNIKK